MHIYVCAYSCLGNPKDRGAWRATVHGVAKSRTQLTNTPKETAFTIRNPQMTGDHIKRCSTSLVLIRGMNIAIIPCRRPTYKRSGQIRSVAQSCPTLCDPMNHSTPGLPVHHQLLEFTQTQIHRVSDAIQSSPPLLSPSPLASNPSQHQSLFQ